MADDEWWLTDKEKAELFWTNKRDHWTSEDDKKRIFKKRLQDETLSTRVLMQREKHAFELEKIRQAQSFKEKESAAQALSEFEIKIGLRLLDHGLKPDELDLDYHQTIRLADITLQSLDAELAIKDKFAHQEHKREVDKIYQTVMMEITKESARILDEQNKAIAINKQETIAAVTKAKQAHEQTLEKDFFDHQHQMERDDLLSRLKRDEFTHEEVIRLIVALIAKQMGLNEGDVSEEQVKEWVADFGQAI